MEFIKSKFREKVYLKCEKLVKNKKQKLRIKYLNAINKKVKGNETYAIKNEYIE